MWYKLFGSVSPSCILTMITSFLCEVIYMWVSSTYTWLTISVSLMNWHDCRRLLSDINRVSCGCSLTHLYIHMYLYSLYYVGDYDIISCGLTFLSQSVNSPWFDYMCFGYLEEKFKNQCGCREMLIISQWKTEVSLDTYTRTYTFWSNLLGPFFVCTLKA